MGLESWPRTPRSLLLTLPLNWPHAPAHSPAHTPTHTFPPPARTPTAAHTFPHDERECEPQVCERAGCWCVRGVNGSGVERGCHGPPGSDFRQGRCGGSHFCSHVSHISFSGGFSFSHVRSHFLTLHVCIFFHAHTFAHTQSHTQTHEVSISLLPSPLKTLVSRSHDISPMCGRDICATPTDSNMTP